MPDALLRFVHISDTHISPDPNYNRDYADYPSYAGAKALVEQVNSLPFRPDFVLHTGDVAYDPYPQAYAACRELLGEIQYPVYYLAGNHDESVVLQRYLLGRDEPVVPLDYTFEVNGVQIICVDSSDPDQEVAGYVNDSQLEWLSGLCRAQDNRPLVIAVHHNMLPVGIPWLDDYMRAKNGEQFHETILPARDRIRGVFFGHIHQNIDVVRDGILYCSVLSSWMQLHLWPGMTHTDPDRGAEPGFNVVTIYPQQTLIRRHRFPAPG